DAVAAVIAAGIIPGGMEMMDKPAIHAVEEFVHAGYPLDVELISILAQAQKAADLGSVERLWAFAGNIAGEVQPVGL
ncbi:MAG: hypothetical protein B7Y31_15150, partial [Novosphingobium sp. 16-62-11]